MNLNKIVVITHKKSFWASNESKIFPNIFYSYRIYGHSTRKFNSLISFIASFIYVIYKNPSIIFFGSTPKLVPWYIKLKKFGLFKNTKYIVTNQLYFNDTEAKHVEKIIIYSKSEFNLHNNLDLSKYICIPLPADGFNKNNYHITTENFIFSGGGAKRDYNSLIKAFKNITAKLIIVTFPSIIKNINKNLPQNIKIKSAMPLFDFLSLMAKSKFVIAPLEKGDMSHGQTTVVQALCLGKPVITTRDASVEDYIIDGYNGILVDPYNIKGYEEAIEKLLNDHDLYNIMKINAFESSLKLTYSHFKNEIIKLCNQLLKK